MTVSTTFWSSIAFSLTALFLLGAISTKFFGHKDLLRHGIRMLITGGLAIGVGATIGRLLKN